MEIHIAAGLISVLLWSSLAEVIWGGDLAAWCSHMHPSECYNDNVRTTCPDTCRQHRVKHQRSGTGCEYGDKHSNCAAIPLNRCDESLVRQLCGCVRCRDSKHVSVSITSQTPSLTTQQTTIGPETTATTSITSTPTVETLNYTTSNKDIPLWMHGLIALVLCLVSVILSIPLAVMLTRMARAKGRPCYTDDKRDAFPANTGGCSKPAAVQLHIQPKDSIQWNTATFAVSIVEVARDEDDENNDADYCDLDLDIGPEQHQPRELYCVSEADIVSADALYSEIVL